MGTRARHPVCSARSSCLALLILLQPLGSKSSEHTLPVTVARVR